MTMFRMSFLASRPHWLLAKCHPNPFESESATAIKDIFFATMNAKAAKNIPVVAKDMIDREEGGSIVNISSMASQQALDLHAAYSSSKAALDALTKNMALELGPHTIRVNSVNPTVVMTALGKSHWSDPKRSEPMLAKIPLGRFAECEDVAVSRR